MFLVCYRTGSAADPIQKYDTVPGEYSDDAMNKWLLENPGCAVDYVFDAESELRTENSRKRILFEQSAPIYGMSPMDYGREVQNGRGETLRLIGFRSKNTKYKVICLNTETGHMVKCPVSWIKKQLSEQDAALAGSDAAKAKQEDDDDDMLPFN